MTCVAIGLGSNLGDRQDYLNRAIHLLGDYISDIRTSRIYESPAMLPDNAPDSWNISFLNMAIIGNTALTADTLLLQIKQLEVNLGRQHSARWSPREIDIDILTFGDQIIDNKQVNIPHPGLLDRAFVLYPLAEINSNWIYPRPGIYHHKTIGDIMALNPPGNHHHCRLYIPDSKLSPHSA